MSNASSTSPEGCFRLRSSFFSNISDSSPFIAYRACSDRCFSLRQAVFGLNNERGCGCSDLVPTSDYVASDDACSMACRDYVSNDCGSGLDAWIVFFSDYDGPGPTASSTPTQSLYPGHTTTNGTPKWLPAVIVVPVVIFIALIIATIWYCLRRRRSFEEKEAFDLFGDQHNRGSWHSREQKQISEPAISTTADWEERMRSAASKKRDQSTLGFLRSSNTKRRDSVDRSSIIPDTQTGDPGSEDAYDRATDPTQTSPALLSRDLQAIAAETPSLETRRHSVPEIPIPPESVRYTNRTYGTGEDDDVEMHSGEQISSDGDHSLSAELHNAHPSYPIPYTSSYLPTTGLGPAHARQSFVPTHRLAWSLPQNLYGETTYLNNQTAHGATSPNIRVPQPARYMWPAHRQEEQPSRYSLSTHRTSSSSYSPSDSAHNTPKGPPSPLSQRSNVPQEDQEPENT